jgi:chemotaxis protein methyltransferase CheR
MAGTVIQRELDAEAFDGLRGLVLDAGGIDLSLYKEKIVLRRIATRQRACGAPTLRAYLKLVSRNPTERGRLVQVLTIHVSQFFRNPSTFRAIQEEVLPTLLSDKQSHGGRALRIWSVVCACGEEPYSLAILLRETGVQVGQGQLSVIYATDIDPGSLSRARAARYRALSLVHVPTRWRQRYFVRDGDDYRVIPEAHSLVVFKPHDILGPPLFGRIDLVVCRNVLIYMTEAFQERVLLALHDALTPGGYLVLGKVEGLSGAARDLFGSVNVAERIYRKPDQPWTTDFWARRSSGAAVPAGTGHSA